MLRTLFRVALLVSAISIRAGSVEQVHGTVRRDTIWSSLLGVRKNMLVYLPPSYDTSRAGTRRYPLAVYLHGRWGDETDWVDPKKGNLARTMDSLVSAGMPEMIIAMPDGDDGFWMTWATTPDTAACRITKHREERPEDFCVPHPRYDEYVAREVVGHIDSTYRTLATRESRGLAGLSMGGYGAVLLAAQYPEEFSVAVSSGGTLMPGVMADSSAVAHGGRVFWRNGRTRAELERATGKNEWEVMAPTFGVDSSTWTPRDPVTVLRAQQRAGRPLPALLVDAALDDVRLMQNRVFRDAMAESHIPLSYAEWGGTHTWKFWQDRTPDGLRFIASRLQQDTRRVAQR